MKEKLYLHLAQSLDIVLVVGGSILSIALVIGCIIGGTINFLFNITVSFQVKVFKEKERAFLPRLVGKRLLCSLYGL